MGLLSCVIRLLTIANWHRATLNTVIQLTDPRATRIANLKLQWGQGPPYEVGLATPAFAGGTGGKVHVTSTSCTPEGSGANRTVSNSREVPLNACASLGTVSMEVTVPTSS
jgi:hypothetical protein